MAIRPSRKQARRDAVFLLYQRDTTGQTLPELCHGHRLREGYEPDEFTVAAVEGVLADRAALDATIASHAPDWPLDRIAPLERSVLRLAVWEMVSGATPPQVAIAEAVRLTKRYATSDAAAFVNGVLGGIAPEQGDDDG